MTNIDKDYNTVLFQAGHLFMTSLWLFKIMVDLMAFKEHPKAIRYMNRNNYSRTLGKYRRFRREKSHNDIVKKFVMLYTPDGIRKDKIEATLMIRHGLGHCFPSLGKEYVFMRPVNKDTAKLFHSAYFSSHKRLPKAVKINMYDYKNYEQFRKYIIELDEIYFPFLAGEIGLDYQKIR